MARDLSDDERALLAVVKQMRRFDWGRFLLGFCAAFHLVVSSWLALAPLDQVETSATMPALWWASRYEWAVVFLLLGASVAAQLLVSQPIFRLLTWMGVLFVGGMWLTAFGRAVLYGEGSAAFIGWGFLFGLWMLVFARLGLRKR